MSVRIAVGISVRVVRITEGAGIIIIAMEMTAPKKAARGRES